MPCLFSSLRSQIRDASLFILLIGLAFVAPIQAATFTVSNLKNAGAGSLRQAVTDANALTGADTVVFAAGVTGEISIINTILITDDLELIGAGADQVTISNSIGETIFQINEKKTVTLSKLKLIKSLNGIKNYGNLTVNECAISDNKSSGISNADGANLTVNNSTISNNTANTANTAKKGGGIYNGSGSLTVNNNTISGNTASCYGGGIFNGSGSLIVNNSTISGNTTSSCDHSTHGGGIYSAGGKLSIGNSIVAGNKSYSYSEIDNEGNFSSLGYNLFGQNHSSGVYGTLAATDIVLAGNITTAIAPLADNGGSTETHLLTSTSQALDAGNNSLIPIEITTDQRGAARIQNDVVDIGAIEGTEAFIATAATFDLLITKTGKGTITSGDSKINCGATCSASFAEGTSVTLNAVGDGTSTFTGWTGGGCSGTGSCVVTMNAAQTVTATFAAPTTSYTLSISKIGDGTVTSNPVGINCGTGSGCSAKFDSGKAVTLTAVPTTGATFVQWTGCIGTATNAKTCTVTLTSNKTITATFTTTTGGNTTGTADFVITNVVLTPATPAVDNTFLASITVKNQGTSASVGGYLDVWANQSKVQICGAHGDKRYSISSLNGGASKTLTVRLPTTTAGSKTLRAFIDSGCTKTESNEANNQFTKTYTVK